MMLSAIAAYCRFKKQVFIMKKSVFKHFTLLFHIS